MFDSHVNNQQQEQNNSTFTASTSSQQPSEVKLLTTQTKTLFIETLTDKQKEIEMATRGQSTNPTWFEEKQNRITASICKDVFAHMQNKGSKIPEKLIKKLKQKEHPTNLSAIHMLNSLTTKVKD